MFKASPIFAAIALACAVSAPAAAQERVMGAETSISFAINGGLRNWQPGPKGSDIVFVQDRRQRWYPVKLSGPCLTSNSLDTMLYRTSPTGQFDRFSRVWSSRFPDQQCGVDSITNSMPPAGQPGGEPTG